MSALSRRHPRLNRAAVLGFALAVALVGPAAGAEPGAPADPALPPDLEKELDALLKPGWQTSASARLSAGYRNNVLLSTFTPQDRGFLEGELDALALRPVRRGWEWLAFLNGDVLRYLSHPADARGEQQWFAHGEGRWIPTPRARLALAVQGYYQDMVVDLSENEAVRVVAPLKAQGALATVSGKLVLPAGFSLEPSAQGHLSDYRDYAGDFREVRGGARLEWKRWDWLAVSAAWFSHQRRYRDRNAFTAGGRALPGTRLSLDQQEGELRLVGAWHAAGAWTATVQAGRLANRDSATGYFDYDRQQARLVVAWIGGPWTVTAEVTAQRYDYLVQRVGVGIAPPPRIADNYDTQLRVERKWNERWTSFVDGRWERNRSNEEEFNYRGGTARAGIVREF